MKVSIMVLTFNRSKLLKETIDSILNQTFKDFEIIVVDNYSSDNTEEIINSYNDIRIRYFKNRNNGLLSINRNFAIKKSKGEFIAICDDDDLWFPQKLEKQLLEFNKDKEIGLVCTNGFIFNNMGLQKKMNKSKTKYISLKDLLKGNTIICCSVMIKKSFLDNVGIFDESKEIFTAEDYELWLRISKKHKIKYIDTVLVKYRLHNNALQNTYLTEKNTLKIFYNVYKKLLYKKIIDNKTYKKSLKRLKYKKFRFKIFNFFCRIKYNILNMN